MDKSDLVTLAVAIIAGLTALASQRQSAKAAKGTNETTVITSRTEAEKEAYIRARTMDTETINRQGAELKEMRAELENLDQKYETLMGKYNEIVLQNQRLRDRIIELEKH